MTTPVHSVRLALSIIMGLSAASVAVPRHLAADDVPTALADYVSRPEDVFSWRINNVVEDDQGRIYEVELTSQQWHGITWNHLLLIHEPAEIQFPQDVLLFVTGGSNGREPGQGSINMGRQLAQRAGARVAMLFQVPNQPLLGGRKEDDLITETWLRYLKTGDATWPLLLPMVKSAVKAMDAVQAIARSQWNGEVSGFVIAGASKRGWTSWLTPVVDPRVTATAPIVIDVLNFLPQMRHQLDTWGRFSEQIVDYTGKGLVNLEDESPREAELRRIMDPFTYRGKLALPKLLINGTNDRYWVLDAMKFYWDDLIGPKYVLQVPNAGHGLDGGADLALGTLAAFFRHVAGETPMPELEWSHSDQGGGLRLTMRSSPPPKASRLWVAYSDIKDFREAKWSPRETTEQDGALVGEVARPPKGHVALFGELLYEIDGLPYSLSTLVRRE